VTLSYRRIAVDLARRIRLVMTDVDGTLSADGESFDPAVAEVVLRLRETGITVGLVSGRTVPRLESVAECVGAKGPLIAENGAVAKLSPRGDLISLGYSRRPALEAVSTLKASFPDAIHELFDNKDRIVDVTIRSDGVACRELETLVPGIQLLDSGYMIHLMPQGISKGGTLLRLLPCIEDGTLSPEEVLVFGDSPTDVSLFKAFPHSVRILNPGLPREHVGTMEGVAAYESEQPVEKGFMEVVHHVITVRNRAGR
jgi:hydroxymethylpyrimidine pyrophosphatase-like HAD family hydrolase